MSYFLTMGVEPEDRRRMQVDLLQHYLDVRTALGGTPISFDDAWAPHRAARRVQRARVVPRAHAALQRPGAAGLLVEASASRAMLSLEDLETVDAIRDLVDLTPRSTRPQRRSSFRRSQVASTGAADAWSLLK